MPVAYHAISFRDTRTLLAIASFEKQELPDEAARIKLRDTLTGTKMPVAVDKGAAKVSIASSYIAIDVLSEAPPRVALMNPLRFKVDLASTGEVVAGDGNEKIVTQASLYTFDKIDSGAGASPLKIKFNEALPRPPTGKLPAWLVLQSLDPTLLPIAGTLDVTDDKIINFPLQTTIAANTPFLLFVQDSRVIAGKIP